MRATALACLLAAFALSGRNAFAQPTPSASVDPVELSLGAGPSVIEVSIDEAPQSQGYQFVLSFDASLVAVTAVEDGTFLTSEGGTGVLTLDFSEPGQVGVYATNPGATEGTAPAGAGSLARVTLAPLQAGGPASLGLSEVALVDLEGVVASVEDVRGGAVSVVQAPPESVPTEAAAQATALAATSMGGGSSGLVPDLPDLGDLGTRNASAVWLGLLLLAVAVVLAGWLYGRRPKDV
jgi:hypothetical protein